MRQSSRLQGRAQSRGLLHLSSCPASVSAALYSGTHCVLSWTWRLSKRRLSPNPLARIRHWQLPLHNPGAQGPINSRFEGIARHELYARSLARAQQRQTHETGMDARAHDPIASLFAVGGSDAGAVFLQFDFAGIHPYTVPDLPPQTRANHCREPNSLPPRDG